MTVHEVEDDESQERGTCIDDCEYPTCSLSSGTEVSFTFWSSYNVSGPCTERLTLPVQFAAA